MTSFNRLSDDKLLRKYKNGADIDDADEPYIRVLCDIGLMKTGISMKRKKITAKTTEEGLMVIGESP
jgi:hypothetical protein